MAGFNFFAYRWKLPAYSGAFLLTIDNFSLLTYNRSFFAYNLSFFAYNCSFLACNGKVRLLRALKDCKQRKLTVSKEAPPASKKRTSPLLILDLSGRHRGIASLVFLHRGSESQRISAARNAHLDSVNIWCIVFFLVLKPLACGRQSRCLGWTYKLPGGQKSSIKLSALSIGFTLRKTFKFNKKTPVYKLPRGAICKPPCVRLINSPFFAIHQVFALLSIARIFASHRIAISMFSTHRRSHRIAARIARYVGRPHSADKKLVRARGPKNWNPEVFD